MLIKNSLNLVNQFSSIINSKLRKIYLNSNFYNNKISKIQERTLVYKPNPFIMDCLVKYNKRKKNINEINFDEIWKNNSLPYSDYKKLHNFFFEVCLCCSQPCYWDSKRRARNIIQSNFFAKINRLWISAMFTTNS